MSIALAGIIWIYPPQGPYIMFGYDTNKDGNEDTRDMYHIEGSDPNGARVYKHIVKLKDLNEDGVFDPDTEVVWRIDNPKI